MPGVEGFVWQGEWVQCTATAADGAVVFQHGDRVVLRSDLATVTGVSAHDKEGTGTLTQLDAQYLPVPISSSYWGAVTLRGASGDVVFSAEYKQDLKDRLYRPAQDAVYGGPRMDGHLCVSHSKGEWQEWVPCSAQTTRQALSFVSPLGEQVFGAKLKSMFARVPEGESQNDYLWSVATGTGDSELRLPLPEGAKADWFGFWRGKEGEDGAVDVRFLAQGAMGEDAMGDVAVGDDGFNQAGELYTFVEPIYNPR